MTTLGDAIKNQEARTLNDMKARRSTADANVDLFFKIGASRGKDIIPSFVSAFVENEEYALRITQWARDIRAGAGERQLFKDILLYLDSNDRQAAFVLMMKIPEIGRWDDLLINYKDKTLENTALNMINMALDEENALCAKWMPRKGPWAIKLRNHKGLTPKKYRKLLVRLTNVVETKMCNKDFNNIDFSKVPSLAHSRYKTAFYRNAEKKYTEYVDKLTAGDIDVKVNAGAVYPYDVIKGLTNIYEPFAFSKTEKDLIQAQWDALENFVNDANVFPMVDVSGSMFCPAGRNKSLTCMDVAVSLGLYLADKNTGKFQDCFLTFSENPEILRLKGNIIQKIDQMSSANWGMNTNLHKALQKMLDMGIQNNVPEEEMPEILLILSDMQFDECINFDDSAYEMINRKYKQVRYSMPKIVFWNINSYSNVPVRFDMQGTALVSGFSPSIMKAVLNADFEDFTPEAIMFNTIMDKRYDL